jgi:hypothetical protein
MPKKTLDLSPFGIHHVLKADFDFAKIKESDLRIGKRNMGFDRNIKSFTLNDGKTDVTYTIIDKLGEGTYGIGYSVKDPLGKEYAIKYIKNKLTYRSEFIAFIKECIIQILVVSVSIDHPQGPFAPKIYDICYDSKTGEGFIRSELMKNTLDNLIKAFTPEQNNAVVPDALKQISIMLQFLQKELHFNHRDMKGDNIMYSRSSDGTKRLMRLIDFGMSCIYWNDLKISGNTWFDEDHSCFKKDRDMTQLIYYIQRYKGSYISEPLRTRLQYIIRANIGKSHKCDMAKLCPKHGLKEWKNVYNFVNRANVSIPGGKPEFIEENMQKFLEGKPFESPIPSIKVSAPPVHDPPHICPPDKVFNPKTRRCVKNKKVSLVVARGPDDCPPDKVYNPKTGRCVNARGLTARALGVAPPAIRGPDDCPPDKVYNPKTGRCVNARGLTARALGVAPPAIRGPDDCPPDKVYNPATRRCVHRDGVTGRRLTKKARR